MLDVDEVLAFLGGRLARYKLPKSVLIVGRLPRTAAGKVSKGQLRARYGFSAAPTGE